MNLVEPFKNERLKQGDTYRKFGRCFKDAKGESHSITDWHTVILWRGLADLAERYLRKGSLIYLEGKLKIRNYDSKEGVRLYVTEIIGDRIILLDKRDTSNGD